MRQTLIELVDNPNFISGVYNYCDRWCERCPFSSRCLVYATEKENDDGDPQSRDITNEAFRRKLASIFAETQQMMATWAEEAGIDLSQVDEDAVARTKSGDLTLPKMNTPWQPEITPARLAIGSQNLIRLLTPLI